MVRLCALLILYCSSALAAPTISAPASVKAGSQIAITVAGSANARDFVTIVPAGAREGVYESYDYLKQPSVRLPAPAKPGAFEVRVLGAESPYPTLARKALTVESVSATLDAPAQVPGGKPFQVRWTGPNNDRDYIGVSRANSRSYLLYAYTRDGNPLTLTAPDEAGAYELHYYLATGDEIIATKPLTITAVSAMVKAPAQVAAGAAFQVNWEGPNNARDFITIVKAGTPAGHYAAYEYTAKGSPVQLRAPDQSGEYEVRYLTAQSYATLATAKLTVGATTASLQAPAEASAGTLIPVKWQGPNYPQDYVTIVRKGAREGEYGNYAYTAQGTPAQVRAPLAAGEYELRYATGQSNSTLARQPIRIVAGKEEPGFIRVTGGAAKNLGAVEIILDASGSMLQKLGPQRRIDIAKQTLLRLTSEVIPAGTPFALRVFGREVNSCQTDLAIAVSPLNAAQVSTQINALVAKNNAKTPIGASLQKAAEDLHNIRGERLVIVLTDGEETCGGDPAAAIRQLQTNGVATRVSIVGFAIDDPALAATFRRWSDLGQGSYFNAKDAAGLNEAMTRALRPTFEVIDAKGQLVVTGTVGGDAVPVPAGSFTLRMKGTTAPARAITVKPKETTAATW